MNYIITPDIPNDFLSIEYIQEIVTTLEITNCYLNYIFCALVWLIIIIVVFALYKLFYKILFGSSDI